MGTKLIAFDLDGTLLREDKSLAPRTREALFRAAEQGIHLVPATGRLYQGIPEEVRDLPFIRYAITANGAEVYDAAEKKVLHRAEMSKGEALRMLRYVEDLRVFYGCYERGRAWTAREFYEQMGAYALNEKIHRLMRKTFQPQEKMWEFVERTGSVQKFLILFQDWKQRERVFAEMKEKFPEYEISSALKNNVEVTAKEATKGNALLALCGHLGIDSADSMAFGDGLNDISMLEKAGVGVAMKNAEKEILEIADRVTLTNEEDGVAAAMEELLGIA